MELGFLFGQPSGGTAVQGVWAEGQPVRSIWVGLKLKGRRQLPVTTYRCTRCGYLESFAPSA